MKFILATGCADFIGSNFVPYFLEKYSESGIVKTINWYMEKYDE